MNILFGKALIFLGTLIVVSIPWGALLAAAYSKTKTNRVMKNTGNMSRMEWR